jgi:hypothetical protein
MAAAGTVAAWIVDGWQSAALFAVGAACSGSGIWEWRALARAIGPQTSETKTQAGEARRPSIAVVLLRFSLRLLVVGFVLYVSLRCLHGSPYALLAGVGLAMVALTLQALRL